MRILHTADWHFGKTLEGRDRLPEQEAFVDELCALCRAEQVDLVMMAGDAFQTVNPSAQAERLFYDTLSRLADHGQRAVVVIAGNHDNPERLAASAPIAERLGITLLGWPRSMVTPMPTGGVGRVERVAGGASWLEIQISSCAQSAVIAALPYPSEARLNEVLTASMDELEQKLAYEDRVAALFAELSRHFRRDTVNLAMSHLYVQGGQESDSEIQIQVGGAYAVTSNVFPGAAQYVALGHLHRPQSISGRSPIRYSGSPLAYSFSESGQTKTVTCVDVEPGRPAVVRELPISSGRPLVRWVAREGLPQVFRWVDERRDLDAWIDLELHVDEPLSLADTHLLRNLRPGLVGIRPVLPGLESEPVGQDMSGLPVEDVFVRFFQNRHGVAPGDELVRLFLELSQVSQEQETDLFQEDAG